MSLACRSTKSTSCRTNESTRSSEANLAIDFTLSAASAKVGATPVKDMEVWNGACFAGGKASCDRVTTIAAHTIKRAVVATQQVDNGENVGAKHCLDLPARQTNRCPQDPPVQCPGEFNPFGPGCAIQLLTETIQARWSIFIHHNLSFCCHGPAQPHFP